MFLFTWTNCGAKKSFNMKTVHVFILRVFFYFKEADFKSSWINTLSKNYKHDLPVIPLLRQHIKNSQQSKSKPADPPERIPARAHTRRRTLAIQAHTWRDICSCIFGWISCFHLICLHFSISFTKGALLKSPLLPKVLVFSKSPRLYIWSRLWLNFH